MQELVAVIAEHLGRFPSLDVGDVGPLFDVGYESFGVVQGLAAWAEHGAWIEREQPRLAPDILARFHLAKTRRPEQEAPARERAAAVYRPLTDVLNRGGFIIMPTAPAAAQKFTELSDPVGAGNPRNYPQTALGSDIDFPLAGNVRRSRFPVPNTDGVPRGDFGDGRSKGSDSRCCWGLAQGLGGDAARMRKLGASIRRRRISLQRVQAALKHGAVHGLGPKPRQVRPW